MTKSDVFKIAWKIAAEMVSLYRMPASQRRGNRYGLKYKDVSFSKTSNFPTALKLAWEEYRVFTAKNEEEKIEKSGRYIELLSVAEKSRLNHGKAWIADWYNIDSKSINPSWEGEEICYVYVA